MVQLSFPSSIDDSHQPLIYASLRSSIRRFICDNSAKNRDSRQNRRSPRLSVFTLRTWLFLAVLAAATGTVLPQEVDSRSTPESSTESLAAIAAPPRDLWTPRLVPKQQAPEEQALPQIGGIV